MSKLRIFIGCLHPDTDPKDLLDVLRQYASVTRITLATDPNSSSRHYCLGYGFALCTSKADIGRLVALSNTIVYRGRQLSIREFVSGSNLREKKSHFNSRRLFVGNISASATIDHFQQVFEQYGPLENIYFVKEAQHNCQHSTGYVVFKNRDHAQLALENLAGTLLFDRLLRVERFNGFKSKNQTKEKSSGEKSLTRIQHPFLLDKSTLSQQNKNLSQSLLRPSNQALYENPSYDTPQLKSDNNYNRIVTLQGFSHPNSQKASSKEVLDDGIETFTFLDANKDAAKFFKVDNPSFLSSITLGFCSHLDHLVLASIDRNHSASNLQIRLGIETSMAM